MPDGALLYAGGVHAAAVRVELYLPECRSLKVKRSLIRPVIEGLRKRQRLSVSEVANHDAWHLATIGVAAVAPSHTHLTEILDEAERFIWSFPEVEVLGVTRHWLEEEED